MSRYEWIRYKTPEFYKPKVCVDYLIDVEKTEECRRLYGYGTSAFWACLGNTKAIKERRECKEG